MSYKSKSLNSRPSMIGRKNRVICSFHFCESDHRPIKLIPLGLWIWIEASRGMDETLKGCGSELQMTYRSQVIHLLKWNVPKPDWKFVMAQYIFRKRNRVSKHSRLRLGNEAFCDWNTNPNLILFLLFYEPRLITMEPYLNR